MICGAYSQIAPGTPSSIMESLLSEVYKPVLTYIYQHPEMKIHFFLSGAVLEWFELHHPEINMLIADLVKKEQLEMLTGAYYQPLLSLLHPKDRSSHIEATTTFIRKRFGKRPKTVWLFNQMWSPNFVSTLHLCSVDRLLISTYNTATETGYIDEPFVMQDIGKTIEVFPINHHIEEMFDKFRNNEIGYDELKQRLQSIDISQKNSTDVVMLNLDHLYQASNNSTTRPSAISLFEMVCDKVHNSQKKPQLLNNYPLWEHAHKRGYLLTGWYGNDSTRHELMCVNEMLTTYEQLQHLYGRLIYVSELARLYKKNKDVRKRVESLIMKSQSGGPFVLDSSGGCYRPEYRQYVYKHLNEAEKLISQYEPVSYPREVDIDADGHNEVIVKSRNLLAIIHSKGGALSELNYLPTGWNYGDTFSGSTKDVTRTSLPTIKDGVAQHIFNDVLLPYTINDLSTYDKQKGFDTGTFYWPLNVDEKVGEVTSSLELEHVPFSIGHIGIKKNVPIKKQFSCCSIYNHKLGRTSNKRNFRNRNEYFSWSPADAETALYS